MNEIVSVDWLNQNLDSKDLILLDSSLENTAEGVSSGIKNSTIIGARYFNLKKDFSNSESPFPNTLPSIEQFESECQKLGINRSSKIIVFDNLGIYSSPRVWWLFKVMGHEYVSVLNGGLKDWMNKGFTMEKRKTKKYQLGDFKATFKRKFVKTYQDVIDNLNKQSFSIVDARSEGRFNGTKPEPRKYLRSGHIPYSINIPYGEVIENGRFKSELELKQIFEKKFDNVKEPVFSCGSGLTACIVMMACEIAYKQSKIIYDGSWSEWAELQNLKENDV